MVHSTGRGHLTVHTPPSFCIGGGLCFFSGDRGGPSSCTRGYFSQLYLTLCTCPWHREPHAGLQGAAGSLSLRGTRLSLGAAVELDILMHYMDGWRKSFLLLLMLQSALAQINPVPWQPVGMTECPSIVLFACVFLVSSYTHLCVIQYKTINIELDSYSKIHY